MSDDRKKKKRKALAAGVGAGAAVVVAVVVTLALVLGSAMDQHVIYPEHAHSAEEPHGEPPAP